MSRRRQPAAFAEADENLADMLDSLAGAENYLDFIIELMSPHLQGPILEVGSGLGDLTGRLAGKFPVVATDVSDRCLDRLRADFGNDDRVRVENYDAVQGGPVPGQSDGFGAIVMSNVLEHLPDDRQVLENLSALLRPGGTIIIFVPAFEFLYGSFDQQIGHHRRYRTGGLHHTFQAAGLEPTLTRYVNLPGWFAWLVTVRVLGLAPTGERAVRIYDRLVMPTISWVERRFTPPFGQSVLGVARARPAGH